MVWLGMILAMILAQSVQWWSEWGFRVTVLSSLGANLVVSILSGTRRRSAPGILWGFLGLAGRLFLWLAYQVAEAATTNAIGSLSLCGSDASSEEKQVVAFWAPFLLLHLGGPDNLTAYSLEDNKISNRKLLEIATRVLGVTYTINSNTHRGGRSWALLPAASVVMLIAGAVRYVERANALRKANLESMQEDARSSSSSEDDFKMLKCTIKRNKRLGRSLRDGEALLLAQGLFPIWRHALVDSSVNPASPRQQASEMLLSVSESDERERRWDWENMCKVAEMELSLIYDFLYTKAILAHTCYYYLIRLLSPLCTAAAAFLFWLWLHPDDQQQQQPPQVRGSFAGITYGLLAITFIMDVAWLLRALGSTWAYAYLREQAPSWLRGWAAGRRWWCRLHRIVVRLDPLQLSCRDPVSHRRWSGTIGRYNLLHECSAATTTTRQCRPEWWPVSMVGDDKPKEMGYLSKLPPCVKEVVFRRVTKILQETIIKEEKDGEDKRKGEEKEKEKNRNKDRYTRMDIRTHWGLKAFRSAPEQVRTKLSTPSEAALFGEEFVEDVLLWHIVTCMVLLLLPCIGHEARIHACAIEVMSEYMMFLVAVRRQMLPGLVLHSQLEVTRKKLVQIWDGAEHGDILPDNEKSNRSSKEKLAMILRRVTTKEPDTSEEAWSYTIPPDEGTQLVVRAVQLYFKLSGDKQPGVESSRDAPWPRPLVPGEMLEFIFNVWVDKLVYAAARCSREAHAQQLTAGGDLTTVLWMLIQHAGPFCIGEAEKAYIVAPVPPEKKKKEEEEKKKKEKFDAEPPMEKPKPPPKEAPSPPPPPPPPLCPPFYHPSYPPVCTPYYDPSWPPVCPWYPQCPPQHERPGDEPEDEHQDSDDDEEEKEESEE